MKYLNLLYNYAFIFPNFTRGGGYSGMIILIVGHIGKQHWYATVFLNFVPDGSPRGRKAFEKLRKKIPLIIELLRLNFNVDSAKGLSAIFLQFPVNLGLILSSAG